MSQPRRRPTRPSHMIEAKTEQLALTPIFLEDQTPKRHKSYSTNTTPRHHNRHHIPRPPPAPRRRPTRRSINIRMPSVAIARDSVTWKPIPSPTGRLSSLRTGRSSGTVARSKEHGLADLVVVLL
eukprot:gnl/Dysnectes_brevis/11822_a25426_129.p1 GENE.gnl/Dysnectes_brevis/11822_a25426_129~~gnl/Dysnectes_brevis/11822_a25426_129.p1  ORF type:complete len:125 (-),score=0.16 gnl/Dysnectes_brevis/11822_a25426_129:16-390(-)